jgi:hypothetical protein
MIKRSKLSHAFELSILLIHGYILHREETLSLLEVASYSVEVARYSDIKHNYCVYI